MSEKNIDAEISFLMAELRRDCLIYGHSFCTGLDTGMLIAKLCSHEDYALRLEGIVNERKFLSSEYRDRHQDKDGFLWIRLREKARGEKEEVVPQ